MTSKIKPINFRKTLSDVHRILEGLSLIATQKGKQMSRAPRLVPRAVNVHERARALRSDPGDTSLFDWSSLEHDDYDFHASERRDQPMAGVHSVGNEQHDEAANTPVGVRSTTSMTPTSAKSMKARKFYIDRPEDDVLDRFDAGASTSGRYSMNQSHARTVPSSQASRFLHFGSLAIGLVGSSMASSLRRSIGIDGAASDASQSALSHAATERLVATLCRLRGAALKIGQILSMQDEAVVPRQLQEVFERVRQAADFMPKQQMERQLATHLGANWRELFDTIDERPVAAASIGQVHRATLPSGESVAVKIQYPGVARSIDSDIDNLSRVLGLLGSGVLPRGLFMDETLRWARRELKLECDYRSEASNQRRMRELLADDADFVVPLVYEAQSGEQVLTTEFVEGVPVDAVMDAEQEVRDWLAAKLLQLTLRELFEFGFMQTDPNWTNFLFDARRRRIALVDFGACSAFDTDFLRTYMEVIHAAAILDRDTVLSASQRLGFLTGDESEVMKRTHVDAVIALALPFREPGIYDFGAQKITHEIRSMIPTMLDQRLCPPPEEIYALHRKLNGTFLICAKLRARIDCHAMFQDSFERFHENSSQTEINR